MKCGYVPALVLLVLCQICTGPGRANQIEANLGTISDPASAAISGVRDGSFIAVPIPFSNPTVGSGLVLGAGYLFTSNGATKPSGLGFGALRSDNGSEAYGGALNFASADNRWLFASFFGTANVNYDLYTGLGKLPIRQKGNLARLSLAYGVTPQLSFGGALSYLESSLSLNRTGGPALPAFLDRDRELKLMKFGLTAQFDRRDDSLYPTQGTDLYFEASHGWTVQGISRRYDKAVATFDMYTPLGSAGVLAGRLAGCATSQETPFFDQCSLGGTDAFRGFSSTEYLADRLVSAQVEYRRTMTKRLGAVMFAGIGWTGDSLATLHDAGRHSAAGIGVRYRVSTKYPVDLSIDGSINDQGDELLNVYVGQRF
ncbi:BamA/TamA family outer membrane protein [Rhodobacteraceae bacterium F11138]|nr:BamA/TamA family outer membrane protein [Rhodobacteraceae bacterium F11138]